MRDLLPLKVSELRGKKKKCNPMSDSAIDDPNTCSRIDSSHEKLALDFCVYIDIYLRSRFVLRNNANRKKKSDILFAANVKRGKCSCAQTAEINKELHINCRN